ncbi:MAG: class I SAM-dependent methyltransferase [Candidatus Kapabacteria bacterium]|nr:class I SAM-dependent methyltransferase [Candidatus Kapabacteria bacterium]MCS7169254.1 class I SAM-dependent methyltransferase [Candidatus Kapabacteria bacterium]MDW7996485.1 class I SAM-dependent methyltransferase [Bacteroidota bacterium]MDW8225254.1 class I SAM-dependent methyltransferase [Bacteroidota bacterium]
MTESCGHSGAPDVNPEQRAEVVFRDRTATGYAGLVAERGHYWWYTVQQFLLRCMGLQRGGWLYDAGCGVGVYALKIAEEFPTVRILAVDFSACSLELLRESARERGLSERIVCVQADITQWVAPSPVRWVLCTEVLQHIPTQDLRLRALQCFAKSLMPGGELWMVVARYTCRDQHRRIPKEIDERAGGGYFRMRFVPDELRGLMRQAGFSRMHLFGAPVPPARIGQRLPRKLWKFALWLQRVPGSFWMGRVLIARARLC